MNKKKLITGVLLLTFLSYMLIYFMSDWIMNVAMSLLGLWELVKLLEMPHKFYGLTIMLFISWKILEAIINLWIKGFEYSIKMIKDAKCEGGDEE